MRFDGSTYAPRRDGARLTSQLERVAHVLINADWVAFAEIKGAVDRLAGVRAGEAGGATEAALSARLRDLRKERFANVEIERRCEAGGLWRYRVAPADRERLRRWLHARGRR